MTTPSFPRPPRGGPIAASAALAVLLGVAALGASGAWRLLPEPASPPDESAQAGAPLAVPSAPTRPVAEPPPLRMVARVVRVGDGRTLAQALAEAGLTGTQARDALAALSQVVDFAKVPPGGQVRVERAEGEPGLRRLGYRRGPAEEWTVEPVPGGALAARPRPVERTTQLARLEVEIESSPYEAMLKVGEDPLAAVLASEVLAWDVDFYQDVRRGDRLRLVVEKEYADGRFLRFGEVRAAEYDGQLARRRLFLWRDPRGQSGYYDDQGSSARRGLLRAPIKFAQVTSRFGGRKHPVLGYTRTHRGIDYAAPVGTPVWAVGDGTVMQSGRAGDCGTSVELRHRNGFTTRYCHLSAVAVKVGDRVAQKQVIGATGRSGLVTGPHLHYEVRQAGHPVNPLQLRLPREQPVPALAMPEFARAIAPVAAQLAGGNVASR